MPRLTAILRRAGEKPQDSEKLLNLYRNRAELKKEFARMRKEQFKLKDRIRQQEGAAARLQQKLDHLEGLLVDRAWAGNVIVFYQLRGVAMRCERKLARLAEQLKQQREQRLQSSLLAKWNSERAEEARGVEAAIAAQREATVELERQMEAAHDRLAAMSGFLRFVRKRSVNAVLEGLTAELDEAGSRERALLASLEEIRGRRPPESEGLDLQTKRSINFMILSFAQQLYLHFRDGDLAAMAKEATEKSVGAINYGDRRACEALLERICKRMEALEAPEDSIAVVRKRAKLISEQAMFRSEADAVPIAGTVATLYDIGEDDSVRKAEANLLGDNYWGLAKILSR